MALFMELFAGKVGRIRAKILHITKNLPDPTPMNSSTVSNKIRTNIISMTLIPIILEDLRYWKRYQGC